jgi:hypothetical protein
VQLTLTPPAATSATIRAAISNGADVAVFYDLTNPPDDYNAPVMATGTTDSSGHITMTLNTSMITDLGDDGDGNQDAFNADVIATWGTGLGMGVAQEQVMTLGTINQLQLSPDPASVVTTNPTQQPGETKHHEDTAYSYVPVLAENSGSGMKVQLQMTYTTSTDIQTKVQGAVSFDGTAPFSAAAFVEEEKGREYTTPFYGSDSYHRWVWASYRFWKWHYKICNQHACANDGHRWVPHDWTGDLTDDNPNPSCNGCAKVGHKEYNVPPYTTNVNYTVLIDPVHQKSAERHQNIINSQGFELDFAGFVGVKAKATYGSITWVKWTALSSGCSSPQSRLLWGNGYTVPQAPIVQANCFIRPS